jgi:hypothetical protein
MLAVLVVTSGTAWALAENGPTGQGLSVKDPY